VLDHGRIVACGSHRQLLESSELYREIVTQTSSTAPSQAPAHEHALAAAAGRDGEVAL
jgi:ATP-binding cassette, subfamily B, bacterial